MEVLFRKLRVILCAIVIFVLFGMLTATAQQVFNASVSDGLKPLAEDFEPVDLVLEENTTSVIRKGPAPAITQYRYYNVYKATDTGEVVVATHTIGYGSKTIVVVIVYTLHHSRPSACIYSRATSIASDASPATIGSSR